MLNTRCHITGNPCGTDTWRVGYPCQCAACQDYLNTMEGSVPMEIEINLIGAKCPVSIIKLNRSVRTMASGDVAIIKTDDPGTVKDLIAFAEKNKHFLETLGHGLYKLTKA